MKKTALLVFLLAAIRPAMAYAAPSETDDGVTTVFTAGEITVNGKKESARETVTAVDFETLDKKNIAQAVEMLPGINISNVGGRNEGMINVRGFDMRQVPLYLDGVPLYVPYDGYVDPNRFMTFDLSEVTISKGFTSVLFGPNTLGGAINMVSRKPEKAIEGSIKGGGSFGADRISSDFGSINLGSNQGRWYVQGGLSLLDRNFVPMSGSFAPMKYENGGARDNSDTKDVTGTFRIGYTPNSTDEYSLSFNGLHSEKGVPVYTGTNLASSQYRYWRFGNWDKSSLYYIGRTALGEKSYLKSRAYFDNYYNTLEAYDGPAYTTQNLSSSFSSRYDDKTVGGSVEFGTSIIKDNTLKLALLEKHDLHNEIGATGQFALNYEDNTFSVAAENTWAASKAVSVIGGIREDFRKTITAQDFVDASKTSARSFPLRDNQATSYQLAVVGHLDKRQELTGYVARTTRFPTLKDRYSYKMGKALPNAELAPEQSWNYGLDYTLRPSAQLTVSASLYQSKLSDVIQQVYDPAIAPLYQLRNAGKATFTGTEFAADWKPEGWLKAHAGYGYIVRKNDTNPNLYFTDVPRNKLTGYLQFLHSSNTWALVETEYNSKRYSNSNGLYMAGSYAVVNLRGSAGVSKVLSLQASVNNLFDRNYTVSEGYPESGREYVASMTYAF